LIAAAGFGADLTGNWMVAQPLNDGTTRRTYFNLKQEGERITGGIRTGQFYYRVAESRVEADGGYTLMPAMMDGHQERKQQYQVRLTGEELHILTPGRGGRTPSESVAHRTAAGEGAMPAKIPVPALHKVPYNGLAKTPPMGWNSWNKFASRVDDASVRGMADAMVSSGMKDAGYVYINIDDTWEGERDARGNITSNKKFPDMKALADYVHGKGLKLGIYSSPGPNTCAGYEGTYGHEEQDAKTWAAWGIDYLKYDWCGARNIYTDEEMQAVYQKMGDALRKSGRQIVYSLCQYGRADVWRWGPEVSGNLWRTTGDIRDTWDSMMKIGFSQNELAEWAAPGQFNDPDMLEIGNGGMNENEYRVHMTLWSMLAAPLIAGNDIRSMTQPIKEILLNREVIAIDQDRAGKQGRRISAAGDHEIWVRELADGGRAIALFNKSEASAKMTVKWSEAGLRAAPRKVRDLWTHADLHATGDSWATDVPPHGVALVRAEQ
jgi:alpha-galactosidase